MCALTLITSPQTHAAILNVSQNGSSKNITTIQETSPAVTWFIEEVSGPMIDFHVSLTFDSQLTFQSEALPTNWSFQESVFNSQRTIKYFYEGTDSGVANESFDLSTPWTSEYFLIDTNGTFGLTMAGVILEVAAVSVGNAPLFMVSAGSHMETLSADVVATAVPEPSAYALGMGGILLGWLLIRRKFKIATAPSKVEKRIHS